MVVLQVKKKQNRPLHQLDNTLGVHEEHLSVCFPLQGRRMVVQNICNLEDEKQQIIIYILISLSAIYIIASVY